MIKSAAILSQNRKIYVGKNHAEILWQEPMGVLRNGKQGFVTDDGRFVDRVEGLRIALENNQVAHKH